MFFISLLILIFTDYFLMSVLNWSLPQQDHLLKWHQFTTNLRARTSMTLSYLMDYIFPWQNSRKASWISKNWMQQSLIYKWQMHKLVKVCVFFFFLLVWKCICIISFIYMHKIKESGVFFLTLFVIRASMHGLLYKFDIVLYYRIRTKPKLKICFLQYKWNHRQPCLFSPRWLLILACVSLLKE